MGKRAQIVPAITADLIEAISAGYLGRRLSADEYAAIAAMIDRMRRALMAGEPDWKGEPADVYRALEALGPPEDD